MPRDHRDEPLTDIDLRALPPAQHFAPKHAPKELHRLAGSASGTGGSSGSLLADAAGLLAPLPGVDRTNAESLEEFARRYRERVERALALEAATIEYENEKHRAGVVRRRIERKQRALATSAAWS